ncbi:MAG: efflux RND transporter permease subunit [Clostridia bacterium]|nr:efflux RND transporter permease subunit [Clostridia bacterium]
MLSRFSVKKPLTVIMALFMVIILGYVSFTNMSTDLLPNMDLPYVAIFTVYGGAGPEKVETALTKPLEQTLSTTNGVENVTSISAENYCVIVLEFAQNTNLDSAIIEMSSRVSQITSSLDESVGEPMYLKINPDLLPVVIASADYEGLSRVEVAKKVEEDVIPALERVEGVAAVSATGIIENTLKITIDDEKTEELNNKILAAVDETLLDTEKKLDEAQEKLDKGKAELEEAKKEQNESLADATVLVQSGMTQLLLGKSTVDTGITLLGTVDEVFDDLDATLENAEKDSGKLKDYRPQLKAIITSIKTVLTTVYDGVDSALEKLDKDSEIYGELYSKLNEIKGKLERRISRCDDALSALRKAKTLNEAVTVLREFLHDIESKYRGLMRTMESTAEELGEQYELLSEQYGDLESGKMTYSQEITLAQVKLDNAQAQLDAGRAEFEAAKEKAYEAAGLDGAITVEAISGLISAENFAMPVGSITEDNVTYAVKVGDKFADDEELISWELFNIEAGDIGVITLEDLATVEHLDNSGDMYAKVNGNDGILITVDKQSTYSTTDVAHNIQDEIKELESEHDGLTITALSDQGEYIDVVIGSVMQALIGGGILAILILIVFLKDWRPTLIIAISIPSSLLFAIVLMYFTGVSLNIISLSGLALGVGMLVDNSIVVVENIYRLKSLGMPVREAAIDGAKQMAGAIVASTLTTASVFLPIVFTQGITKQIFADMGLTIAYSLFASLIVALTLVPALSSKMLVKTKEKKYKVLGGITNGYAKLLDFTLRKKAIVLVSTLLLFALSLVCTFSMGTEFIPESDMKQMSVTIEMPIGTSDEDTRAMSEQVIDKISTITDIDTIAAMQGGSGMMSMMGGGEGGKTVSMYLLLKDDRSMTSREVGIQIEKLTKDLDCTVTVASSNMSMSMLTGSGVQISIKGTDLDDLQKAATDIGNMLRGIEGTKTVTTGLEEVSQEIRIIVDKNKAMANGYTVAQVYMKVAEAIATENTATTIEMGDDEYAVVVAAGENKTATRESLENLELEKTSMTGDAQMTDMGNANLAFDGDSGDDTKKSDAEDEDDDNTVLLKDIAQITLADTPKSITHENQVRTMTVNAEVEATHNVGKLTAEFERKLESYDFPGDCYYVTGGENEYIESALRDLLYMLFIALAFIYMIMVAQFQSLKSPFIVMFTIPLAFTGGFLLLWALGFNLSIVAMLGLLVLAGVVVNNGIVFVDYANQLVESGMNLREAMIETGKTRIRPIIMTAITTILGLVTMALGIGEGTDMVQPMAIVVIGGLIYATLLTLFVIPALYEIFNKKSKKKEEQKGEA